MVSYGCYKCGFSEILNFELVLNTLISDHERLSN